ncbi:MAG: BatA and WFA domain-containing protein [Sedimentisphaerales bacterium]|nr:BatA and WFA domain-containing protein [Sedimentisphaerales bacterium]
MSFLYPLFLAGIAAIALPIVLHMIRRQTRKRIEFSSLMFLRTSIPRFKNRTRIENLLLLILRCIIICLLAFAFSRPFFVSDISQDQAPSNKRMVLLIDTSASMRRAGIWESVLSQAKSVLKDVSRADRLCVMSFDQSTKTVLGFEQWSEMDSSRRSAIITDHISKLSPGWFLTNLDNALINASEAIEDDKINDSQQTNTMNQVILISDLQKGSNLNALNAYEWPEQIQLTIRPVGCPDNTNAALQLVTDRKKSADDGDNVKNIRIINSTDAVTERFRLSWYDDETGKSTQIKEVYVPAGHSIVVPVPAQEEKMQVRKLIIAGDDHDFDNMLFLAPFLQQQVNILYVGSDNPADSKEMLFYLQRAFRTTNELKFNIISYSGNKTIPDKEVKTANLIITADTIDPENIASLRGYLRSGRTLLLVMKSADDVGVLKSLSGIENIKSDEADVDRYAMLSRIEFKHPLFVPFSDPRFGDFTQIHFWKYRGIKYENCPDAQILSYFDSDDPALIELPIGKGTLLILTSSWKPSDSQLALSSKFVPILYSILEYGGVLTGQQSQYFVGDHVSIPHTIRAGSAKIQVRKPDDSLINPDTGEEVFTQTDMPGIYTIETSAGNHHFAVNLSLRECQTTALQIDDIEKFGISFKQSSSTSTEQTVSTKQKRSFAGMENEQKVWRWVLAAVLAVSLIEIWLAGWLTRSPSNQQGEKND